MSENSHHPFPTLTRIQLTLLMITAILGPFMIVVWMTSGSALKPELRLQAETSLELLRLPSDQDGTPRWRQGLRVRNPTTDEWRNVSIGLNNQFFYYHPNTVRPGEEFELPLSYFVTKGGNIAFRPANQKVSLITIYAQVPSGARAIYETRIDDAQ